MKKALIFYYEYKNELVICDNLMIYGYFLAGFQIPEQAGYLCTLSMNKNGGTILTPVYNENKEQIYMPEHAGKEVKELKKTLEEIFK